MPVGTCLGDQSLVIVVEDRSQGDSLLWTLIFASFHKCGNNQEPLSTLQTICMSLEISHSESNEDALLNSLRQTFVSVGGEKMNMWRCCSEANTYKKIMLQWDPRNDSSAGCSCRARKNLGRCNWMGVAFLSPFLYAFYASFFELNNTPKSKLWRAKALIFAAIDPQHNGSATKVLLSWAMLQQVGVPETNPPPWPSTLDCPSVGVSNNHPNTDVALKSWNHEICDWSKSD